MSEQLYGSETPRRSPTSRSAVSACRSRWCIGRRASGCGREGQRAAGQARRRARRPHRWGRRVDRRRRPRRSVPDRRLPDRLGHLDEHERQRGVISALTGGDAHPNDHVNMGQSSNDTFPSAVHLARSIARRTSSCRHSRSSRRACRPRPTRSRRRQGRPHAPLGCRAVTLGQEFSGYAAQLRLAQRRVKNALPQVGQIPLGGTATGTGLNSTPTSRPLRARSSCRSPAWSSSPRRRIRSRRRANRDALVELSGALKVVADEPHGDRERHRADGFGPARRHR